MADQDYEWLSDYVVGVFKSPTWVIPIAQFVDDHCDMFDEGEENKIEWTECHNQFKQLVSDLFTAHLLEVSVSNQLFEEFCRKGLSSNQELHRVLVEQLLSVDDFVTFKAMLLKQSADIDCEVIALGDSGDAEDGQSPTRAVVQDIIQESIAKVQGWQLYDDQLFQAVAESCEDEERLDAQLRREEAELQHAIALSMQLEEERLHKVAAESVPVAEALPASAGFRSAPLQGIPPCYVPLSMELKAGPASPPPPGAGFRSQPLCHVLPDQANTAAVAPAASSEIAVDKRPPPLGFTSSPLTAIPPKLLEVNRTLKVEALGATLPKADMAKTMASENDWRGRAERAIAQAIDPASPLGQARRRTLSMTQTGLLAGSLGNPAVPASHQITPAEAMARAREAAAGDAGGPSEEERRARAEHLRRQRDRLLEKRRQDREKQLASCQNMGRGTNVAAAVDKALAAGGERRAAGRRLVSELTSAGAPAGGASGAPASNAEAMRQALTLQLRQTLAGASSGDMSEAAVNSQIDRLHRLKAG